jgi:D-glycero-D-manno-heptose 1,7-bisphosphate phosphatase
MDRAVFLDRDGTINVEREYVHLPEEFEFIPGAPEAIRALNGAGFRVIVVSNQSGIARGFYDESAVARLHLHMDGELARFGAKVDAYYYCPHHPDYGTGEYRKSCDCRKPMDGMLRRGAKEFSLDLSLCYMIGDRLVDVEAALRSGCRPMMVMTGYGGIESPGLPAGVPIFDDLLEAVSAILKVNNLTDKP